MCILFALIAGPNLPQTCWYPSMVSTPNGEGVIIVGCSTNIGSITDKIYQLTWGNDGNELEWTTMTQTLQVARTNAVAMLIPDELTCCKSTG